MGQGQNGMEKDEDGDTMGLGHNGMGKQGADPIATITVSKIIPLLKDFHEKPTLFFP